MPDDAYFEGSVDPGTFRRVLGHYPTGVCVISAVDQAGLPTALVVGSFTSVSLDPPLVAFFPARTSTSWPRIEGAGKFCVNVLGRNQPDLCARFSSKGGDKFEGLTCGMSPNGAPLLEGTAAWIDCDVWRVHEAGDHLIVLGHVRALNADPTVEPLLFLRGGYGGFAGSG